MSEPLHVFPLRAPELATNERTVVLTTDDIATIQAMVWERRRFSGDPDLVLIMEGLHAKLARATDPTLPQPITYVVHSVSAPGTPTRLFLELARRHGADPRPGHGCYIPICHAEFGKATRFMSRTDADAAAHSMNNFGGAWITAPTADVEPR